MMTSTKVRRGTRKLGEVLANAKDVHEHTLSSGFNAEPFDATADASQYLTALMENYSFAYVRDNGNGAFTLRVHSNEWYDFHN